MCDRRRPLNGPARASYLFECGVLGNVCFLLGLSTTSLETADNLNNEKIDFYFMRGVLRSDVLL